MPSRSSATSGSKAVWSHSDPCTSTSGGPWPSTQTASGVPSADRTSNRRVPTRWRPAHGPRWRQRCAQEREQVAGRTARGRGCRRRAAGPPGRRRGRRAARPPRSRCRPRTGRRCPSRSAAGSARRSSPPARGRRGTWGMARSSRTMVGAAATRAGHAGWARRAAISASGISTTSRNIVSTTASRFPSASSASSRPPTPGGSWRARGVGGRPPLVEDEPPDVGGQRRPAERAQPAEGVAVQVDRGPGGLRDRVDHGGDVLELALDGVAGRVAAGAAAAPVQGVDGGVGLQVGQQRPPAGVVGHRAVHQHQRRPLAAGPDGDLGAVAGLHPRHGCLGGASHLARPLVDWS